MSNENIDKGQALFAEIYGQDMADGCRAFGDSGEGFGSLQAKWTLEFPFGQIWTRDEQLPRKLRSFAVLGMLIGQGQVDEIKYHTKMGIANGLTRVEFEEIFYSTLVYAGFPAANTAKAAMLEAFAELEAEGKTIP
ncbi:carboxymuconolactone decarboxylase family protein [Novosphingobium sp. G106]|uniref:carboxymuconolactone decarboxylase family protein n=1 Tax=Novosphingobium sp. G106 TaxID=2849500 RepID=UPI0020C2D4D5|nr:carboxymuconolactone decarboxylase family protein [Novosphingobium sp. G106]